MKDSLTLTLDITYNLDGEDPAYLRENLLQMVEDAMNRGNITGDGPATVESWTSRVEAGPPNDTPVLEYLTLAFVSELHNRINPKEFYREMCQEMVGDPVGADAPCRLAKSDRVTFRTGTNDHADAMEKDHQWFTFNNGESYYPADEVKRVIEEHPESEYEYAADLRDIVNFLLQPNPSTIL